MIDRFVFYYLMLCWLAFALAFFLRKRPRRQQRRKREPLSLLAMAFSGVGFAIVWGVRRPPFSPMFPSLGWSDALLAAVTMVIAGGSVCLVMWGVRTLGEHWSLAAQLIQDHRLVVEGPYAIVRHPIYAGMLGMMLATGLTMSSWEWVLLAMVIGWYGTHLRIRSEERLLRGAFGKQFDEYRARVPSLIPGLHWFASESHSDTHERVK